ncbi:MAG: STAS domain-containing protein [Simkaniaceae bacterium]|nr:STAS domain-containing protein [Simkaniaceae bacterium]
MSVGLSVNIDERDDGVVVRISGRLDATSASVLENKLNELIEGGRMHLAIDCIEIDYMSSAGMRLLLSVTKKLKVKGGKLHLCMVNEEVMEIIRMAGFERILSIFPTEQEALLAFPQGDG